MSKGMQKFFSIERQLPEKRPSEERRLDYAEIYKKFTLEQGRQQSSRCEQCGNPGCEYQCPLGNHIVDWLRLASQGKIKEAAIISQSTNTFPEICGRVCPQDRLCEQNCILEIIDEGAVTIGSIESWINDEALDQGFVYSPQRAAPNGIKVAIIGSGPGGLACAEVLNRQGYEVTVFEKASEAGGLMIFGIPNFKLDKNIVRRRIKMFQDYGIRFEFQKTFGQDFDLNSLKQQGYSAVFLAFGAYLPRPLPLKNVPQKFVYEALPYLIQTNQMNLCLPFELNSTIPIAGKKVLVLGGGDTAMDCLRTSIRKGAESVTCVYRRDRANMPGSQKEVYNATEEGVQFLYLHDVIKIEESQNSALVTLQKMQLGPKDSSGRSVVEPTNEFITLEADVILVAFGYEVEHLNIFNQMGIATHSDGRVIIDKNGMTTCDGVFAGGDCVRGASLVVWAIRDGQDVGKQMVNYLNAKHFSKQKVS